MPPLATARSEKKEFARKGRKGLIDDGSSLPFYSFYIWILTNKGKKGRKNRKGRKGRGEERKERKKAWREGEKERERQTQIALIPLNREEASIQESKGARLLSCLVP